MNNQSISEPSFWGKVKSQAVAAGKQVIEKALVLFYCLQDPDTPRWAKTVIVGALAYFILPFDAIADLLPGIGYTDDLGALVAAVSTVMVHIKPLHQQLAQERIELWFGKPPVVVIEEDTPKALPSPK